MNDLKYTVSVHEQGMNGGREVWVQVLTNEVLDWDRIEKNLSTSDRSKLNSINPRKLMSYYPHHVTPEERAEHGHSYEEWWVWAATTQGRAT